jgi:hypothetical protein
VLETFEELDFVLHLQKTSLLQRLHSITTWRLEECTEEVGSLLISVFVVEFSVILFLFCFC